VIYIETALTQITAGITYTLGLVPQVVTLILSTPLFSVPVGASFLGLGFRLYHSARRA
jgi:hypothetical protein